jgi:2-C-methyl-D-erythritol 2,4-cyclodiphosphate synthase
MAHDKGPVAHSDGDVLAHAIGDAPGRGRLGIWERISPTRSRWRGASSLTLLETIAERLRERGLAIVNVDASVVAEAPRIAPHVAAMREALGRALAIDGDRVSVKATTNEGLGALGLEEWIAAWAVALVEGARE